MIKLDDNFFFSQSLETSAKHVTMDISFNVFLSMVLDKLNNQLQISYKSTITHLFYLFKPIAYLISGQKEVCGFKQKCMQPLCVSSSKD